MNAEDKSKQPIILPLPPDVLVPPTTGRPDAFFAMDVYAAVIIKAASRLGLNVPKDISVVGFDNTEISVMIEPSITTVNQPRFQLGSFACDLLIDKIINPTLPNKHMLLDTELIVRDSTLT